MVMAERGAARAPPRRPKALRKNRERYRYILTTETDAFKERLVIRLPAQKPADEVDLLHT